MSITELVILAIMGVIAGYIAVAYAVVFLAGLLLEDHEDSVVYFIAILWPVALPFLPFWLFFINIGELGYNLHKQAERIRDKRIQARRLKWKNPS